MHVLTKLAWDDPALDVASDSQRTARYRRLQSWYRHHELGAPHGRFAERPVGSWLCPRAVAADRGLNFLSEDAAAYAEARAVQVQAEGGTLEPVRLFHNMLSSMPLCFSIFGHLRALPDRGLAVVRELFDPQAEEVLGIECEWRPDLNYLGDRTAFDAMIRTRRSDDEVHLVGIEVKYTESFSPKEYERPAYFAVEEGSGWFHPDPEKALVSRATNQLWRNTLLAAVIEMHEPTVDSAAVVVLALDQDPGVQAAMAGMRKYVLEKRCRSVSLHQLIAAARNADLDEWAGRLERRYVDTSPVD